MIPAPAGTTAYPRERLFRLLDRSRRESQLTWVVAPPGAGKTVLVASYVRARELPCIWHQMNAGDGEAASFFHHLGLAVGRATPRLRRALPKLTAEYIESTGTFARNFFRDIGRRLRPPFVLVLDDVHEIGSDAPLHEALLAALSELPPGAHAVLISRSQPPAAYARARVNRNLTLLDWPQLRLREDECRALVRHFGAAGRESAEAAQSLHRRCEGWIAGLILLLEARPQISVAPDEVRAGLSQALLDYFASEVFMRRAPYARDFLLQTALFPGFTASMAEHLTHQADAASLLEELVRQHHFTERRADSPSSFQYHALFREFLLAKAADVWEAPELEQRRRRAAQILEEEKRLEEAVPLYLAAGDSAEAMRLIRACAQDLAAVGRYATLAALIEALPAAQRERDPWLLYWHAVARAPVAPAEARTALSSAFAQFDASDDAAGLYLTWTAIAESYFAEYRSYLPVDPWIEAFTALRARHPRFPSAHIEARVLCAAISTLQQRFFNHPLLPELAARLEELIATVPDANQRVLLSFHSLLYHISIGHAEEARRLFARIRPQETHKGMEPLVHMTWCMCASLFAMYFGDTRTCLRHVDEGLALANERGLPPVMRIALLYQAVYGSLATSDVRAATRYLEQFATLAAERDNIHAAIYRHCAAMTAAHRGDLEAAELHGKESVQLCDQAGVLLGYVINLYAYANIRLLRGDRETGLRDLAAARAIAVEKRSLYLQFLCRFSEAVFTLEEDRPAALSMLRDALATSRRMQGPSIPWLPQKLLARAYAAALEAGIETEHVTELIGKLDVAPTDEVLHVDAWPWPVKVYTLGRFGVTVDGIALKFPTKAQKKPLDLLKVLIAAGGRNIPEDRLAGILWPDGDPDRAALAFTTTLHRLRKLIGPKAIERAEGRITLNARVCWVDAWALERMITTSERAAISSSAATIETLVANLTGLYRGPFLSDHDEQSWLLATRERIRDKVVRLLGSAADALVRVEQHEQAVRCLRKSLEIEPVAEDTYRRLMQLHLARQQRSEALAAYHRCRKMLAAHFGVEPSPDTERIRRQIQDS